MIGPQDLQVVEELHTVCFRRKHSVIPVLLVAGVLTVDFRSVDHRHCLRKILENRCNRNNAICKYCCSFIPRSSYNCKQLYSIPTPSLVYHDTKIVTASESSTDLKGETRNGI